ncbi:MscL family protein [Patescibacteria group bacterium]|nr:MscL family protein [Patescibacteria group bacterium]
MKGFLEFIRKQGVVGLAVGFILGGAISKVVASVVEDLINPLLGLLLGAVGGFDNLIIKAGTAEITIGKFIAALVDFLVIAAVVYFGVKGLGLEKLDKKEEKK